MDANHHPQGAPIAWIADPVVDVGVLDVGAADTRADGMETVDISGPNASGNHLPSDNVSCSGASNGIVAAVGTGDDDLDSKGKAIQVEGQALTLGRGRWGHPDQLTLPVSDRGLQLADGLFETLLVAAGQPLLLDLHLERWRSSAALLGMAPPPGAGALTPRIAEAVRRSGIQQGALRLNWSRGSGGRGLDLPAADEPQLVPRFWLQLVAWQPSFNPLTAIISRQERRHADSLLSRCKSFAYAAQIQARREARAAGADDALLLNGRGELCCGSAANLLVRRGSHWLTPADNSGCLPGIMRRRALESGLAREANLSRDDLLDSDGALLINSLSCRPLLSCNGQQLPPVTAAAAEALWRDLLV